MSSALALEPRIMRAHSHHLYRAEFLGSSLRRNLLGGARLRRGAGSSRPPETSCRFEGKYLLFVQQLAGISEAGSNVFKRQVWIVCKYLFLCPARREQIDDELNR